ncbi:GTPase IMAP family member 9-like isoform 2-T2 [Pholidichthys leucotaenia]
MESGDTSKHDEEGGFCVVETEAAESPELRIVLLGKIGAGKSSAGNTMLGRRVFQSHLSSVSICLKETGQCDGQPVTVVDTPGLFSNMKVEEEVIREISACVSLADPGPQVFLVVLQAGRFTEEEQTTVKIIQTLFGEKAADHFMVLFTHGDDIEADGDSIEEIISENPDLRHFISQCHGRYHVLNNRDKDPSQARELLRKINQLVWKNGGRCYTQKMFDQAEGGRRDGLETLYRQNSSRRSSPVSQHKTAAIGAVIAGGIGAGVGLAVGGLLGIALGTAVGVPVGAIVGHRVKPKVERESCITQ